MQRPYRYNIHSYEDWDDEYKVMKKGIFKVITGHDSLPPNPLMLVDEEGKVFEGWAFEEESCKSDEDFFPITYGNIPEFALKDFKKEEYAAMNFPTKLWGSLKNDFLVTASRIVGAESVYHTIYIGFQYKDEGDARKCIIYGSRVDNDEICLRNDYWAYKDARVGIFRVERSQIEGQDK